MTDSIYTRDDWLVTAYAEHIDSLIRYLRKITGSHEAAEDLTHDAFINVFTAKKLDLSDSPTGYLYTAAKNLALSRNSSHRVTRTEPIDELDNVLDEQTSIERDVQLDQELHALQAAMSRLPPQQYDIMRRYAVGQTYQNIADELRI